MKRLKRGAGWPKDLDRRVKEEREREGALTPMARLQNLEALARPAALSWTAEQNRALEDRIREREGEVERYRVMEAIKHAALSASEERPAAREDFGEYPTREPITD